MDVPHVDLVKGVIGSRLLKSYERYSKIAKVSLPQFQSNVFALIMLNGSLSWTNWRAGIR